MTIVYCTGLSYVNMQETLEKRNETKRKETKQYEATRNETKGLETPICMKSCSILRSLKCFLNKILIAIYMTGNVCEMLLLLLFVIYLMKLQSNKYFSIAFSSNFNENQPSDILVLLSGIPSIKFKAVEFFCVTFCYSSDEIFWHCFLS